MKDHSILLTRLVRIMCGRCTQRLFRSSAKPRSGQSNPWSNITRQRTLVTICGTPQGIFFFKYHSFVPCQCNSSFLSAFLTDKNLLDCLFLFMMAHSFRLESDDLPFRRDIRPVIQIKSTAHAMIGFANDAFVGNLDQVYNSHISQIAGTKLCTEKKINNLLRYWAWK